MKTILLHMANDDHHRARLEVGLELARRFCAYLDVLYVTTPINMPAGAAGRAASYAYIAEATDIARERAAEIEHEIRTTCQDVTYSWTVVEGEHAKLLAER